MLSHESLHTSLVGLAGHSCGSAQTLLSEVPPLGASSKQATRNGREQAAARKNGSSSCWGDNGRKNAGDCWVVAGLTVCLIQRAAPAPSRQRHTLSLK
jgi:hypothetical protein